jgi:hypothetical protein
MALSLSPQTEIPRVKRKSTFSRTVTVTAGESETINSISVVLQGEEEPDVNIIAGNTSFTISGVYRKGFSDSAKYITDGSSDLLETPVSLTDIDNIPSGKELFEYFPDTKTSITKTYSVSVNYNNLETGNTTENFTMTHIVENNVQQFTTFINSYYNPDAVPYILRFVWTNQNGENIEWTNNLNETIYWEPAE